jgi:curved DNA-binding protein CbpA
VCLSDGLLVLIKVPSKKNPVKILLMFRRQFLRRYTTKDLYKILDISPQATPKEIKSKFYALSKQYHPDRNTSPEATQKFVELNEAYSILSNQKSKLEYDESLKPIQQKRQQWSSRGYRNAIDPNDWILYRRPGQRHPGYNYRAHQQAHYPQDFASTNSARAEAKRQYYRELYESQGWSHQGYKYFIVASLLFMLFSSDLFQILWMDSDEEIDVE